VAAQEAAALMAGQASGGGIVLVGAALREAPAERLAAALSQGAIPHMALCLAAECAARHPRVRVNCVVAGEFPAGTGHDRAVRAILSLLEDESASGTCLAADGVG
jgi:hypothetical protein